MLAYFSLRRGKTLSVLCTNNTLFTYRQCKKSGVCAHLDEICDLNNNCSADWKQNHVILSGFQNLKWHIYPLCVFPSWSCGHPSLRVVGVSLPRHTWFKRSAPYQTLLSPDNDPFIWIRRVGTGKRLKHAGQGADGSFCVPDVQQASSTLINNLHTCDYLSSIWASTVELVVLHC